MANAKAFTKKQEAQFNMIERVDNVVLRHESIINSIPALRRHFTRMRQLKASLAITRDARFTRSEGATASKSGAEGMLVGSLQEVGSMLLAFANDTGNAALRALSSRPPSAYARMRDGELPGLAARYADEAVRYKTELLDYGLTDDMITSLQAARGHYEEQAQAPATAISDAKGKTRDMKSLFSEANTLLHEKVDTLLRGLARKYPELARDYNEARIIRNNPTVKKETPAA